MAAAPPATIEARLLDLLAGVPDPEIPAVSVIDLGIVRRADAAGVAITPTYTGCPASQVIERAIREALDRSGYAHLPLTTVLDPPWTTDWISEEGRQKLHAYGIAPPPWGEGRGGLTPADAAECPQCGSRDTEELSRFGSTPCKALWRCRACAEPFDRFKCL
jgi:ring-1,2-phenylacetyl-CoA epoxidase subunit PaaD